MAEKILIISPVDLFPGYSGNRERIRTICLELMNRGYLLDFFYTGFERNLDKNHYSFFNGEVLHHNVDSYKVNWVEHPFQRVAELMNGLKIRIHKWLRFVFDSPESAKFNRSLYHYRNSGKILLLRQQISTKSYRAVIVNYAPYSFYLDLFGNRTKKIIDTHDRLADRYKLFSDNNQPPADWYSLRRKDEKRALSNADVIWAITEDENSHFRALVENKKIEVFTLTHLIPYDKKGGNKSSKSVIMIGSENRLNIEGLEWFMNQVWNKLRHYDMEFTFLIAGSICNVLEGYVEDDRVRLLGLFDSPDEIYSMGEIFINPMQSGTGLKIKSFEALAHGKFVISTKAGATGLDKLVGNGLACSDDPAEWIRQIRALFNDPEEKRKELKRAEKIIKEMYRSNREVISKSLA